MLKGSFKMTNWFSGSGLCMNACAMSSVRNLKSFNPAKHNSKCILSFEGVGLEYPNCLAEPPWLKSLPTILHLTRVSLFRAQTHREATMRLLLSVRLIASTSAS